MITRDAKALNAKRAELNRRFEDPRPVMGAPASRSPRHRAGNTRLSPTPYPPVD